MYDQQPAQAHRPVFLTILAILAIIGGVLSLVGAILFFTTGGIGVFGSSGNAATVTAGIVLGFVGVILLVSGILDLAFGIGTLQGRVWAWILGILAQALTLLSALIAIISGAFNHNFGGAISSNIISILIAGIILFYLNSHRVRAYFGRR
jgi:hypothetical protein